MLTLLGFGLRLVLLDSYPFREDEAIYSFWALHFWHVDPLFLTVWPDKPPIFLWLLAGAFRLFGTSQASARWLNIMVSTLTIPIVATTARHFWGRRVALCTALAFALNPFAISFAATAYTDPLLVLAGSLALYMALKSRAFWAGIWLGIAIMTKQQGVLYLPLVGMVSARVPSGRGMRSAESNAQLRTPHSAFRTLGGLLLITLPILYWDSLRWAVAPSPWDLSVRNYGGFALAPLAEWLARLRAWAELGWYLTASWPVWIGLGVLIGVLIFSRKLTKGWKKHQFVLISEAERRNDTPTRSVGVSRVTLSLPSYASTPLLLITLWSLAFLVFHVISSTQTWDRYLLPLAPLLALLIGWLAIRGARLLPPRLLAPLSLVCLLLLLPPAIQAARGNLPLGGDHGDYAGLTDAVGWLVREYPRNVILYHHQLGWQYQFYLYDSIARGAYELRWFPNPVYLAANAANTPWRHKFFVQPRWSPVHNLAIDLKMRGLTLREVRRFDQMTLFEIGQLPQPFCPWCFSGPRAPWPTLSGADTRGMMSRP